MADTWPRTRRGKKKRNDPYTKYDALAARRVLRDAYRARNEFSRALSSNNLAEIRLRWITATTLLRTVGHVLERVDSSRSLMLATAIKAAWNRWDRHRFHHFIFHEFIKKERDTILKEYRATIFSPISEKVQSNENPSLYTAILVGDTSYSPLGAINSSIQWWETELGKIESEARNPDA